MRDKDGQLNSGPGGLAAENHPVATESSSYSYLKQLAAFAEYLAAENHKFAKELNKFTVIHGLYGFLDGLSSSYSSVKYCFDLQYTDSSFSSSDLMHDWLMRPDGFAIAVAESAAIITLSVYANIYKEDDPSAFKSFISTYWPYARDTLKGLKNAYKGVRGALQTAELVSRLTGQQLDLRYMMVPFGLVLGILSVGNRIWYRDMKDRRKDMQTANSELLLEVQANCRLHVMSALPEKFTKHLNSYILVGEQLYYVKRDGTHEEVALHDVAKFSSDLKAINKNNNKTLYLSEKLTQTLITSNSGHAPIAIDEAACAAYHARIIGQPDDLRRKGLLSASYGGLVDGLYLYMGAMTLAALSPPVLVALSICSVIFTLTCIATRIYEEHDYQLKLIETQLKVELALCGKDLELTLLKLQRLAVRLSACLPVVIPDRDSLTAEQNAMLADQEKLMSLLDKQVDAFDNKRVELRSHLTLSVPSAIFAGLKNGLAVYQAISSLMFAVAIVDVILAVPFSPVFLIACMSAGMASLLIFAVHSYLVNDWHLQDLKLKEVAKPHKELANLLDVLKDDIIEVRNLQPSRVQEAILDGMVVDPSPQFFIQEWFEVVRSFFSGVSKGQKAVDYSLNQLQEADNDGHYHDTQIMLWLTVCSSVLYALGFALRAYVKGFSRDFNDNKQILSITTEAEPQASAAQQPTHGVDPSPSPSPIPPPPPPLPPSPPPRSPIAVGEPHRTPGSKSGTPPLQAILRSPASSTLDTSGESDDLLTELHLPAARASSYGADSESLPRSVSATSFAQSGSHTLFSAVNHLVTNRVSRSASSGNLQPVSSVSMGV